MNSILITESELIKMIKKIINETNYKSFDSVKEDLKKIGFKQKSDTTKEGNLDTFVYRSTLKNCEDNVPKSITVTYDPKETDNQKQYFIYHGLCGTVFKTEKIGFFSEDNIITKVKEIKNKFN